jgi:hypothetical protein
VGKASSAKRVAKVAQSSSRAKVRGGQHLGFYSIIALVVVLGSLLIAYGRSTGAASATTRPIVFKDHWHAAYGVYACDKFLAPFTNTNETVDGQQAGLHTHGDGIMHVHPFVSSASGRNAKLGVFFKAVGVKFSGGNKFELPEGLGTFKNGDQCNGKPATWKLAVWDDANSTSPPKIYITDFANVRYTKDRMAMTLAFVTSDTDLSTLKPTSIPQLDKLTDLTTQPAPGDSTSTTAVGDSAASTTVVGDTAAPTTVAGAATTVGAGATTTTLG